MTTEEFNNKYKAFIQKGFEQQGLMIESPKVISFLDKIFKDLTRIPDFQYSQIKLKFGSCRFYTTLESPLSYLIEDEINKIVNETKQ